MNKAVVKFHLKEAAEQLASTLAALDRTSYGEEALRVELSHIYHHVNSAWNARQCTRKQHRDCSDEDFSRWRRFPKSSEMYLEPLSDGRKKA